jgi:hypothetical protein
LDYNKIILAVTHNAANEPDYTEKSDFVTNKAFLKVTHSEVKEALETALCCTEQQKESTLGYVK